MRKPELPWLLSRMECLFRWLMLREEGLAKLHVDKPHPGLPVQLRNKGSVRREQLLLTEQ